MMYKCYSSSPFYYFLPLIFPFYLSYTFSYIRTIMNICISFMQFIIIWGAYIYRLVFILTILFDILLKDNLFTTKMYKIYDIP